MKIGRGLIFSSVLHLGVLGAVTAHVAALPEQKVEDIPSIAVDLEMVIDAAATQEQQPVEAEATPEAATPEPMDMTKAEADPPDTPEIDPQPTEDMTSEDAKAEEPAPVKTAQAEKPVELPVPELPVPLDAAPDLSTTAVEQLMADVSEAVVAPPPPVFAERDRLASAQPAIPPEVTKIAGAKIDPAPDKPVLQPPDLTARPSEQKPPDPRPQPQEVKKAEAPPPPKKKEKAPERKDTARAVTKKEQAKAAREARKQAAKQTAALAAGRGSTGSIRSTDGKASEQNYKSKILARLRSAKRYPDAARAKELEGTAVLTFTVSASGQLTSARITNGSGYSVLDSAALAMARGAAPFPPFPPGMNRAQMTFRVPVQFNID
ncbi:TonB family protein [Aestuariivirga sp.]|uniref:TonB family protein n=1 Tax=Aestuariivirga sp. TaxID=2650926 RepID=UPI0039E281BF